MTHNNTSEPKDKRVPFSDVSLPVTLWRRFGVPAVIFLSGAIIGAALATKVIHNRVQTFRMHPDTLSRHIAELTHEALDLGEEQSQLMTEIIQRRQRRIIECRKKIRQEVLAEFMAMDEEVTSILDADQTIKWQKLSNKVRRRFHSFDEGDNGTLGSHLNGLLPTPPFKKSNK